MFKIIKLLTTLLIVITITTKTLADTPVRKCSNEQQLPLSVQVESCLEMPCDLWKGYDTNMAIQFVANKNTMTQIKANVQMTTLGIEIPSELEEERGDVCKNLMFGAYCPMDNGEDATYHLILNIGEHQPEVPTKIEVSLIDRTDATILACFIVDARIKKRNTSIH